MKIYLAGPDVFFDDANLRLHNKKEICHRYGHQALSPVDTLIDCGVSNAAGIIYAGNISMIEVCDVVIANLDNFRGNEPDSGTCFEIGYAVALKKKVIGTILHQPA
jgi:nucleoside 2-deoxyribosyltransferase